VAEPPLVCTCTDMAGASLFAAQLVLLQCLNPFRVATLLSSWRRFCALTIMGDAAFMLCACTSFATVRLYSVNWWKSFNIVDQSCASDVGGTSLLSSFVSVAS
jgi:hypothetical protein